MFCRGAFFISSPVDVSGTGEAGGKEKTPKMGRAMMRSFWVQVEQVCDCHRKMERYLNEERTGMFLDSKDWLRLLVFFLCSKLVYCHGKFEWHERKTVFFMENAQEEKDSIR